MVIYLSLPELTACTKAEGEGVDNWLDLAVQVGRVMVDSQAVVLEGGRTGGQCSQPGLDQMNGRNNFVQMKSGENLDVKGRLVIEMAEVCDGRDLDTVEAERDWEGSI